MPEKTARNPRGAGRKPKPSAERVVSISVSLRRPVVEAISTLAKRRGLTRGQYIQRVLCDEARKLEDAGKRGRLLGELYAVALKIATASRGDVAKITALRDAAIDRPAATFPEILEFCSREIPRISVKDGREAYKRRIADLTVELGFAFPASPTDAERDAFNATLNYNNNNNP